MQKPLSVVAVTDLMNGMEKECTDGNSNNIHHQAETTVAVVVRRQRDILTLLRMHMAHRLEQTYGAIRYIQL